MKKSDLRLNKLKSKIKNDIEVTLRLSQNMICDNKIYFPQNLLLTNKEVFESLKANG